LARALRIGILLLIFVTVAQEAWFARARSVSWKGTLLVAVYPASGDGSAATSAYLQTLTREDFKAIERFIDAEAKRYGVSNFRPVEVVLGPRLASLPPAPPRQPSTFDAIVWSLKMRWWASRNDDMPGGVKPHVRMFAAYFDPAAHKTLPHSIGLERGLIGVANLFASSEMADQNGIVVAHELLHTLGATDKYDPATNQPRFPEGYAEANRQPLLPQEHAEIMAGRTPLAPNRAETPESLDQVVVGPATAAEIRWVPAR